MLPMAISLNLYSFGLLAHASLPLVPASVCTLCLEGVKRAQTYTPGQGEAVFILIWISFWLLCTSPWDSSTFLGTSPAFSGIRTAGSVHQVLLFLSHDFHLTCGPQKT